jgi:hypothetical protein
MNGQTIGLIYGLIAIRVFLLYMSSTISSNIMTQIYTDRVLINGEEPPVLNNQLYLFLVIDVIFNIFLFGFAWAVIQFSNQQDPKLLGSFILHYLLSLGISFVIMMMMSNLMYSKKYFLYQDDGLRAIRALNSVMFNVGTFISVLPLFLVGDSMSSKSQSI